MRLDLFPHLENGNMGIMDLAYSSHGAEVMTEQCGSGRALEAFRTVQTEWARMTAGWYRASRRNRWLLNGMFFPCHLILCGNTTPSVRLTQTLKISDRVDAYRSKPETS